MTLKSVISKLLFSVAQNYVRAYRKLLPQQQTEIFVLPPASAGSLGDQALLQGLCDGLSQEWLCNLRQIILPNYEAIQLQGMGILSMKVHGSSSFSDLQMLLALRHARLFCVLGADVIDGRYDQGQALYYLHALDLAASTRVPSRLLSFSISSTPNPQVIDRFKFLSTSIVCCARDPVSRKRFVDFTGHEAKLVADLAFLVTAKAESKNALDSLEWIQRERQGGAKLIALNANVLTNLSDPNRVKTTYVKLINELTLKDDSLRFILVPHDFRDKQSDHLWHSKIITELGYVAKERTLLLAPPIHAWDVKAIAAACDLVVTGRMHLAIAALGSGVPTIGIGYMGKFEGLFNYFDLNSLLIAPQSAYYNFEMSTKILDVLPMLPVYREQISRHVEKVKELSRENFSGL